MKKLLNKFSETFSNFVQFFCKGGNSPYNPNFRNKVFNLNEKFPSLTVILSERSEREDPLHRTSNYPYKNSNKSNAQPYFYLVIQSAAARRAWNPLL